MTETSLKNNDSSQSDRVSKDALLESLVYLAEAQQIHVNRAALVANLPLPEGRLTPELFKRASQRVSIQSEIKQRPIEEISSLVLPAVILLNDNRALIITQKMGSEYCVYDPLEKTTQEKNLKDLQPDYTGYCIYMRTSQMMDGSDSPEASHWFWGTIARSWRIYRDVLVASCVINIFVLANPLFVMNVYDRVVPNNAIETLWALSIGILVLYVFDFVLRLLRTYFIEVAGKKSDVLLSSLILERVLGAKYSAHPESVGAFTSKLREFETLRNFITSATVSSFVDLPFVCLFLIVIAYVGGNIVWVPLLAIPVIVIYAWFTQRRLKSLVSKTFVASAQKHGTLVEAINNLEALKSMGAESRILKKWESATSLLAYWGLKWRTVSVSATTFSMFVQQVSAVLVVIVGVYAIAENQLTQGALIACVILVGRALAPLAQLSGLIVQYHQSKLALESLDEIVNTEQEQNASKKFVEGLAFSGQLECRDVDFGYKGEHQSIIHNVNFSVKAHEKIAIIGRLGCGKSTLQKLLLGLYSPSKGSILFDSLDISQINPSELRDHIGYVPQNTSLFDGSIRENICLHRPSTSDARMLEVSEIAGVADFVHMHPSGYQRRVGERGECLSGGQKQAITIARALVHDPKFLFFDEPTSAMDNATEQKFIERLGRVIQNKTVILATHKTSMLSLVDRIIVMDAGKIIADGDRESILTALKEGKIRVA